MENASMHSIPSQNLGDSRIRNLTKDVADCRYHLEHIELLSDKPTRSIEVIAPMISVVCVKGKLELTYHNTASGKHAIVPEEGYHLFQGTRFSVRACDAHATFLIASTVETCTARSATDKSQKPRDPMAMSTYHVTKPWGSERWYTKSRQVEFPYALKLIVMNKGFRCSLQSHQRKHETLYLADGKLLLEYGLTAPADVTKSIDLSNLKQRTVLSGESWCNQPREIHRFSALEASRIIEISTPELDDVIRWQDDTHRTSGRIASEHPT